MHRNLPCIPFGARGWGFTPQNDRRCRPKGVGGRVQLDAAARRGRRRAAKKAKLGEFNDLERRVAALADRVAELEEELRRRSGDDSLDDDDAQSPRVADAL